MKIVTKCVGGINREVGVYYTNYGMYIYLKTPLYIHTDYIWKQLNTMINGSLYRKTIFLGQPFHLR